MDSKPLRGLLLVLLFALVLQTASAYASGPSVRIKSINPREASFGEEIEFIGEANKTNYEIEEYEWTSDIDGMLSNNLSFSTSSLSTGNHTIYFTARDTNGNSNTAVSWVNVLSIPYTEIQIKPNQTDYGTEVQFTSNVKSPSGSIDEYLWNSNITGNLSRSANFSANDLVIGKHKISFRAKESSAEEWSEIKTQTLEINLQKLGSPVQVIPTFASAGGNVRMYNTTPGYPSVYCAINNIDCKEASPNITRSCMIEGSSSPVLEFNFSREGVRVFSVSPLPGQEIPYRPRIGVGSVNITITKPAGSGSPVFLGNWTDSDFLPYGNKTLEAVTTKRIGKGIQNGTFYSGVFYRLFKVEDCALKRAIPLRAMESYAGRRNTFRDKIAPNLCSVGEKCEYVGEVFAFDKNTVGGALFLFTYKREPGHIDPVPSNLSTDAFIGEKTEAKIKLKNTGGTIDEISAESTSDLVVPALEKDSVLPKEDILLNISITIPEDEEPGKIYTGNITVNQSTEDYKETITIPFRIKSVLPEGVVIASPRNYDFGDVSPNGSYSKTFSLENSGDSIIFDLGIEAPEEFTVKINNTTILPGESNSFSLFLEPPKDTSYGNYSRELSVSWDNRSIGIPVSYTLSEFTPSEIQVTPSSWDLGQVSPGTSLKKTFSLELSKGKKENTTVKIEVSNSSLLFSSLSQVNLEKEQEVAVTFTAPSSEISGKEEIKFSVYKEEKPTQEVTVPVKFKVEIDVRAMIDEAKDRLSKAKSRSNSLEASTLQMTVLHKELKKNLSDAREHLKTAEELINSAEKALSEENETEAKRLVRQANSELSEFDKAFSKAENVLNEPRSAFLDRFGIVFIGIFIVGGLAFTLLAMREGWIKIEKSPKLVRILRKLKLYSFFRSRKMKPKKRAKKKGKKRKRRKKGGISFPSSWSKAKIKKWKKYVKKHPEYASYVRSKIEKHKKKAQKEKKRSYQNKRFE